MALIAGVAMIFALLRFGILGLAVGHLTTLLINNGLFPLDPSRWYFRSSMLILLILAALAVHGFRAALAGRPLFGRAILED